MATINAVNTTLSGQTGTGAFAGSVSPTFTTPILGVATATSINKLVITAPATAATLTIADGKTFTVSNTMSFVSTDGANVDFGAGGTVLYTTGGMNWFGIAGTTQAAAVNSGYVVQNAGQTTVTLPATAALGSRIAIQGLGAGGFIVDANAGQTIQFGVAVTSSGGTLTSANQYDAIEVVCIVANTTWGVRFAITAGMTVA